MAKKALLMILDGWGNGKHGKGDVIYNTPTPYLDYLNAVSAHSELQASGEDVGLPDGQMGNSEVGHLNIGAGRIVYQDLVKINKACQSGDILKNQGIIDAYSYAQKNGKKLHLMGLTSTGGVHSSRMFTFIALWTDVIQIQRVVLVSLQRFRKFVMQMTHISLQSLVVSMQWTVTSVGIV